LHPTFQEYFSALAIHNQDFFLPHEHLDKLAEGKSYRIFEHHWEESFAIWCGRKDKFSHAFHLIQKLTEFRSECSSFFAFRAFFLAAKAEPELNHRKSSEKIINQLIDWAFFTEFSPAISSYWLNCPIPEKAKESLRLTTHNKTILRILKRIESTTNPHYRKELAEFLGTIDRRNTASVKILNELLTSAEHKTVRLGIIESLWTVDPGNLDVIAKLLTLLEDENPVILGFTSKAIRDNKIFTFEILDKLISILKRGEGNFVFELREVLRAIEAFGHGNRYVIDVVIELIEAANRLNNPKNSCILIWTLGEIALKDSKAAEFLMSLLTREKDDPSRWYVAESLGKINVQDQETRNVLIHLTSQEENEWIRQQAAKSLLSIDSNNSGYLYFIVELFKNTRNWRTQSKILEGAEKISSERSKTIDALGACLEASLNDYVKMKTAIVLGKINPGSKKAINTLIKLLENIDNASASNDSIIWNLGEIGEKNSNVAMALISFFERMYKVGRDPGKRGHNQDLSFISRSLCKALDESTYTLAIRRLKAHVSDEAYRNHFEFFKHAYEVIWHCAQNMSYPDFYEAFHWQPVQCESSREETSFNKPYL
jgi:HEAT repeat protein